ncbi:MAG: hypothetical protein DRN00_04020 [Thermoplasmata archaeon]|nr:MAG: hypothetical protein DRN00_04020 [Thermoplasmata archaeon]
MEQKTNPTYTAETWTIGHLNFTDSHFHLHNVNFEVTQKVLTLHVPENVTVVHIPLEVTYNFTTGPYAIPVILTLKVIGDLDGLAVAFAFPRMNSATPLKVEDVVKFPKNVSYKEYKFAAIVSANLHKFNAGYCLKLKRNISAPPLLSVTPVPIEWTWKGNVACYIDNQTTPINSSDIIAVGNGKLKFNIKKLIDPVYWETEEIS